jgi:hypothetical protein
VGREGPELLGTEKEERAKRPVKTFEGAGVLADVGGG